MGFTLKGRQVERQLAAFAQATGGRYYSAQSGAALARALRLATTDRFPYKIFDAGGRLVSQGRPEISQTSWHPDATRSWSRRLMKC